MKVPVTIRPLAWLMAAVIVIPLSLLAYAAVTTYRTVLAETDASLRRNAAVLSEYTLRVLGAVDAGLREAETITAPIPRARLLDDPDDVARRLGQVVRRLGTVSRIGVLAADGRLVASSEAADVARNLDRAAREYFTAAPTGDGVHVGRLERAERSGDSFFAVSRAVDGPEGRRVLAASLDPALIRSFLQTLSAGETDQAALVRADGGFLVRWPPFREGASQPAAARFRAAIDAGGSADRGLLGFGPSVDGVIRRVAYQRVPGYPLYVQAGIEQATVQGRFLRSIGAHLFFGVPATLALLGLCFLALVQDRRARVEAAKLRATEEALEQARRMESLGQLTGGVAHDFNNLLMVLQGGLSILSRRMPDERAHRQIERMNHAVERGATLTRQLLAFGRRQSLQPTSVDARRSLLAIVQLVRPALSEGIATEVDVPADLWPIHVDPAELERALLNVCVNARDAMPDGGVLRFGAANVPAGPASALGLGGDCVRLTVEDTGIGIPRDIQARVFEPFFTTKPRGQGTGLGLSQVYGFAEQSQGRVVLDSTPGRGTRVSLYLRRAAAPPAEVRPLSGSPGPSVAGRTLLLVEDDPDVAAVTGEMLEGVGLAVQTARDGASALATYAASGPFDIVLSDVIMPGELDGFAVATRLTGLASPPTVVLMSGYTASIEMAGRIGIPILRKPFEVEAFVALLATRDPAP